MMKKIIIILFILFNQCFDNKSKHINDIISFNIDVFDPHELNTPYFKLISNNKEAYLQDSYDESSLRKIVINEHLKEILLNKLDDLDNLLVPIDIEKAGLDLITEKIIINISIEDIKGEVENYEISALRCFDGYSVQLYQLYVLLRDITLLPKPKCQR